MTGLPADLGPPGGRDARVSREIAQARARCLALGVSPETLAEAFIEEALLAWMMAELSEHDIHTRLTEVMRKDVREWFYRARTATGQCDCVREVHFAALEELSATRSGPVDAG